MRTSKAKQERIAKGLRYRAWLIDAESEKRNCREGYQRTFYGVTEEEACGKAIAFADRLKADAHARGKSVIDRFHLASGGVIHSISMED